MTELELGVRKVSSSKKTNQTYVTLECPKGEYVGQLLLFNRCFKHPENLMKISSVKILRSSENDKQ